MPNPVHMVAVPGSADGPRRAIGEAPRLDMVGDWRAFLAGGFGEQHHDIIRRHQRTGWPLGDAAFVARPETALGRCLKAQNPGPKRRSGVSED